MSVDFKEKLKEIGVRVFNSSLTLNQVFSGGKPIEEFSQLEILEKIVRQYYIAKEELDETLKAIEENDIVEEFDGLIDVMVTVPYFDYLLDLSGIPQLKEVKEYKQLIDDSKALLRDEKINLDVLEKCADLIIENNASKYTTNKEEFDSWKTKHQRHSCVIDGVTYYYLLDENGKGRKHDDFKNVDLSWIIGELTEEM